MNLATHYLGLHLPSPLIVGASPFCDDLELSRSLQDAGAGALVMRSLFEEQIAAEQRALQQRRENVADSHAEAPSSFARFSDYQLTPERYFRQLELLKNTLTIPVIASLNGCRPGGWTDSAIRMEAAGADAIELNLYHLASHPVLDAGQIEAAMLETVALVTSAVRIPVAVKLSPFHTSPANFALALEGMGARGVVVFNRFYQPDFNIDDLAVQPLLKLSDPGELLLRLHWLAILSPRVAGSLAATGGVHGVADVVKALLAGAHAVQLVSVLLKNGPGVLRMLNEGLGRWMGEHDYDSLEGFRGAMDLGRCPDPTAFERANYQRLLQSWRV